jgi:hypothetical protein
MLSSLRSAAGDYALSEWASTSAADELIYLTDGVRCLREIATGRLMALYGDEELQPNTPHFDEDDMLLDD